MRCPKCNKEIEDNVLVCPGCKKVLKLFCPKCNTVNKTNLCKKCGFVIVAKCHKCGKINQTIDEKCSKCGFSTYTSVAINASNIDEFACLTIDFPNLNEIKAVLGSTKLTEKFKANLDKLILNYTHSYGVTREIIENIYVVRFNKDGSFSTSAKNAMKAAIEIQNLITELNYKLYKLKNAVLSCNIAVLKRDIYSKPDQYKSGFDIKLIYSHKKTLRLINSIQIITDAYIYEKVCDDYDLSALTAKFVKNEMMTFFELNLKKYIKIPVEKEPEEDEQDLAKLNLFKDDIEDFEEKGAIKDKNSIDFNDLRCEFTKVKSLNLIPEIVKMFKQKKKRIVSIKGEKQFLPRTHKLLYELETAGLFKNVFRVSCYDEMKYKPYGFFYELISSIYNFSLSPKNFNKNKFDMFNQLDSSDFIKSLINLIERQFPHPEDVRYSLFDIFYNIFACMQNSIIYIENFEKIDDTSNEVLQLLFEKFDDLDVSYLVTTGKELSLHKKSHFLLTNPNYTEVSSKPTPFKQIIGKTAKRFEHVMDSYQMVKIAQNTKGSVTYFSHAIDYLLEKQVLRLQDGQFIINNSENVIIPNDLDDLIRRRLKNFAKDKEVYKLFGMLLLMGPMIDLVTVAHLEMSAKVLIDKLSQKNYIYVYNNTIHIQNYSLYKENFIASASQELKEKIAQALLEKVFSAENKHPSETLLYRILGQEKQEFIVWEKLSRLNASMGDFSAYLHCSIKFLKLLDKHVDESSQKTIEDYKMEVYENISSLLYKYTPNEVYNIAQLVLSNLEQATDDKKILNLYNKMLQGCFIGGNYSYALDLIHKILRKFTNASINPQDNNFDVKYFLISLVKIEVLFSIGNFKDCVEAGEEILDVLTPSLIPQLKPENLSAKQFEEVIYDAMCFVALSKLLLLQGDLKDFRAKIQTNTGQLPKVFDMFSTLEKIIKGEKALILSGDALKDDKFSKVVFSVIKAFGDENIDYNRFADNIYQAKISAKMNKLTQIELICDLLIGYSYFKLGQEDKASSIYYNILESSTKNGLKMVTYLDWYLISMLKFEQRDIEVAFGIAHNAVIQLEKDRNSGDFIFYLFRIFLAKIYTAKNNQEAAESCLNDAKFIKEKYGLI